MVANGEARTAVELAVRESTGSEFGAEDDTLPTQYRFGEGLTLAEQEWLVGVVNRHLERIGARVTVENEAVPRAEQLMNSFQQRRRQFDSWDD